MRRTIGLLATIILACVSGFAQNSTPQWKVIRSSQAVHQSMKIPATTLFTPTRVGSYRYTAYMVAPGPLQENVAWVAALEWTDLSGTSDGASLAAGPGAGSTVIGPIPFSAQPSTPVVFYINASTPPPVDSDYTYWFTIEQLQ